MPNVSTQHSTAQHCEIRKTVTSEVETAKKCGKKSEQKFQQQNENSLRVV